MPNLEQFQSDLSMFYSFIKNGGSLGDLSDLTVSLTNKNLYTT
jgi:hypothetical protein